MAIANVADTAVAAPQAATARLQERLLLAAAAVLLVWGLGSTPPLVNAEIRCVEVVQEMLATGDYVMPRLDGEPRPHKPPLSYWLSAACCRIAGGFGYAAFRFPSALSAIGIALIVLSWGRRLGGPSLGLLAVALLVVDYLFLSQGRRGTFEMPLAFFCFACLDASARLAARPTWWRAAAAAGLYALAFLAKGTPALLFAPLPLLAWRIGGGQGRELLRPRVIGAVAAALLLGLSWHLYVCATDAEVRRTILGQFFLPFGVEPYGHVTAAHRQPFWYYAAHWWPKTAPAALLLPLAVVHAWRERLFPASSQWRLLAVAAFAPIVVLSFLPEKQDHYLLPAVAPLALLQARAVLWAAEGAPRAARSLLVVPAWLAGVLIVVGGVGAAWVLTVVVGWRAFDAIATGGGIVLLGVACLMCVRGRDWRRAALAGFAAVLIGWWCYFSQLRPLVDGFASRAIYQHPEFDKAAWRERLREYPFLRSALHVRQDDLR